MKTYTAKVIQLRTGDREEFEVEAKDRNEALAKVMALYGSAHWKIESVYEDVYQAVVRPIGTPDLYVFSYLSGDNMWEHAQEIRDYMIDLGQPEYKIIHYAPIRCVGVTIEDIILN